MSTWETFIDVVHVIGALGCGLLALGLAADGEAARALFQAAAAAGFCLGLAHRRAGRRAPAAPSVVDLRTAPARSTAGR